ncbi:hypothetical protein [Vibrio phage CKB-S1]|nr:hypothetical protein [Vibrio phage CKB-S1]
MFKHYRLQQGLAQELRGRYDEKIGPKREAKLAEVLEQSGAAGFAFVREWGMPMMVHALTYEEGHPILDMEGVVSEQNDDGTVTVTADASTTFGSQYVDTLGWINQDLHGLPVFEDWLLMQLRVQRYALGPRKANGAHDKLATEFKKSRKGDLFFKVPVGSDDQAPLNASQVLQEISPTRYRKGA